MGSCYRYPPVENYRGDVTTPFIMDGNERWCGEWKAKDLTQGQSA